MKEGGKDRDDRGSKKRLRFAKGKKRALPRERARGRLPVARQPAKLAKSGSRYRVAFAPDTSTWIKLAFFGVLTSSFPSTTSRHRLHEFTRVALFLLATASHLILHIIGLLCTLSALANSSPSTNLPSFNLVVSPRCLSYYSGSSILSSAPRLQRIATSVPCSTTRSEPPERSDILCLRRLSGYVLHTPSFVLVLRSRFIYRQQCCTTNVSSQPRMYIVIYDDYSNTHASL